MKRKVSKLAVAGAVLALATPGHAFDLGYHADQTRQALASKGFSLDGRDIVVNANLNVDIAVNALSPLMVGTGRGLALRKVHWDDLYGQSAHGSHRAWLLARIPITSRIDCNDSDGIYEFASAIGFILHGIQDYYAHSNHAELNTRYRTPGGTYEEMMQPAPGFELLAGVLRQNVSVDVGEALISGAYFTSPPPPISDSLGQDTFLTHDLLNKDSLSTGGTYLYPDLDRRQMHRLASRLAVRDSASVLDRFKAANPACFTLLSQHRFGRWERWFNAAGQSKSQFFGQIAGHWRSGNPTVVGAGLVATISMPTGYPTAATPARTTWSYRVENTGEDAVTSLTLMASEELRAASALRAPQGWTAIAEPNAIRWTTTGPGIAPGAALDFEVEPAIGASFGLAELITSSGRSVQVAGPVAPDLHIALALRSSAFVDDQDPQALLDAYAVPRSARTVTADGDPRVDLPPLTSRRNCGCSAQGDASGAASSGLFLLGLAATLRRRRAKACPGGEPASRRSSPPT